MRILIADKLAEHVTSQLAAAGFEVTVNPDLAADDLPGRINGQDILVVRSTKVSAETIQAADELSLIVRAGAGVNTIDINAANAKGIYVTNCPGRNRDAVAELAIGLLIACDRRIAFASQTLRDGQWRKKHFGKAGGLKGRVLGVLGCGSIGQAVIQRALSLQMEVIAWSRSLSPELAERLGVRHASTPQIVAEQADAISLHLAANSETKHLVNSDFLSRMKDDSILINTSRGDLVDTQSLIDAIKTKRLRVGLDVFENEPASGEAQFEQQGLASLATCTPHIGASTDQASEAIAAEVQRIIETYRSTGRPPNTVNMCSKTPATHSLVIRHLNRVGVLAAILNALRSESINVEEMENAIFEGTEAAVCSMQLDECPTPSLLGELGQIDNVLQVHLEPLVD